jgi:hypothetical protein
MPGDVLGSDVGTIYYIRSDSAYNVARTQGFWETVRRRIAGRNPFLLSFRQTVGHLGLASARHLGVQTIATKDIVGSLGRDKEFSRCFLPVGSRAMQRERWRQSYTRLLVGDSDSPVQVCKVGGVYFVVNGHHRVSVARYFKLKTIEAHISEIEIPDDLRLNGASA